MARGLTGDRIRQVATCGAVLVGLALGLSGDYGDERASLTAPAGYAFGIWAPIYLGSLAYAVYQARPDRAADPLLRRVGWWAAAGYLLVGLWSRVFVMGTWPTLVLLAATLFTMLVAYLRLGLPGAASRAQTWLVRAPIGLFAGWITLASLVSLGDAVLRAGVPALGLSAPTAAVLLLLAASGIASAVTLAHAGSPAYPVAIVWGLVGVVAQFAEVAPERALAAAAAAAAVAVAGVGRWRSHLPGLRTRLRSARA